MLSTRRVAGLPRFAWVATVERDDPQVTVAHGDMVETSDEALVAGVWDGPFGDFGFPEAATLMGSGGRVTDDAFTFCSASHPFDQVYSLSTDDAVHVSNSLSLLLARTDDGPDLGYRSYRADRIAHLRGGTAVPPASLPTQRGREALAHLATNLTIRGDLSITITQKHAGDAPRDFDEYRTLLSETVHRLVDNGTDPARRFPLRTLTTVSKGYDSAACAVFAAEAGIHDALTLVEDESSADSGQAIGELLGLRVNVRTTDAWQQQPGELEIEFAASSSGPMQIPLTVLDDGGQPRLVLLGSMGDEVWDHRQSHLGDRLSQPGAVIFTPSCLHDFGLRAGIVFVHVPMIGAVHYTDLRRITESAEMAPWSMGSNYDRPVPRRILEDAGVPRGSFAIRKRASAAIPMDASLRPDAQADFDRFWRAARRSQPLARRMKYRTEATVITPLAWVTGSVLAKLRRQKRTRRRLRAWSYYKSLPSAYQFHWAVGRLIDRYRAELLPAQPDSRAVGPADSL